MGELESQKAKSVWMQSLRTKWWITFSRHFLRAARSTLNGPTAHIGAAEKLVPPLNAEPETAFRWSVHPGWESETFRQQRGEICSLLKRDSRSSQGARGPVGLCRRMVCSAWLKVLAGSALEPQNIVYTAEIQFSHGWREARAGLLETTWHTPVLCLTRNTERGVFNYHFLFLFFFFLKLIFSHWVASFLTVPEWITQPCMSICIPNGTVESEPD